MASRDDTGLISAIATGDAAAYLQLHERHVAAARRLSDLVAAPGQAEDVASGAFARLHAVLRDGTGPQAAVRPYLLTEVRRAAGQDGAANSGDDPELAGALLARAFVALPERERATLWHAVIEQADPAQTAAILGVTARGVADLVAQASAAYVRSYLKLYESGHDREDCREVVRGLDHGADGMLSGLDEFAALPHLRACRECRAAAIELADLGRSLRGWVAPVYLGVAATPGYLSWSRVEVAKKGSPAGRRRRTGETPRRPAAPPPRPAEHAAAAATAPHRASRARGRLRNASRQQRVLAGGGLVVTAFAATGLALTMASSNGPAPQPPQHPAPAAIAPPSPAAPAPSSASSSAPAHRRARPAAKPSPSGSPSPAPRPSATASPTPAPVATPPVQDPFPRRHHHHPPL
jgi:DNA-directed RNA polymerase specialized sigma24 family protein